MVLLAVLIRFLLYILCLLAAAYLTRSTNLELHLGAVMVIGSSLSRILSKNFYCVIYEDFPVQVPPWLTYYFLPFGYLSEYTRSLREGLMRAFIPTLLALWLFHDGISPGLCVIIWFLLDVLFWWFTDRPSGIFQRWVSWQSRLIFLLFGALTLLGLFAFGYFMESQLRWSNYSAVVALVMSLEAVQYLLERAWINFRTHVYYLDNGMPSAGPLFAALSILTLRSFLAYYLLLLGFNYGIFQLVAALICVDFSTQILCKYADTYLESSVDN